MHKLFESKDRPLADLLTEAQSGDLQLPDFQRSFVWSDADIRGVLASISMSFPIGSVMVLEVNEDSDVQFRPRAVAGTNLSEGARPRYLLLDGQQRITSLFQTLRSGRPVQTKGARKGRVSVWYYVHIRELLGAGRERDEAIKAIPADKVLMYRREVRYDCTTPEKEAANGLFPLSILFDRRATRKWGNLYRETEEEGVDREELWDQFQESFIDHVDKYQLPVIQLSWQTEKEAVCMVFEKVNTGGVKLSVFELLTAIYAADGHQLREEWDERKKRLREHAVLQQIDTVEFLQLVTLLARFAWRREDLDAGRSPETAKGVGCKRSDILDLSLDRYNAWAGAAERGLMEVVPFLGAEHIFRADDVPYMSQLVPLAALFAVLGPHADSLSARDKIRRWYWCGVLGELYGSSTETRFAADLQDVVAWVIDDGPEPRTIVDASFQAARLLSLRTRNSAAYKGLYALMMHGGARDFHTNKPIDVEVHAGSRIDIHHIFPKAWCDRKQIPSGHRDCIVNKTPIAARTNGKIGSKRPSDYIGALDSETDQATVDGILRSHFIAPHALRNDDFPTFFHQRFEDILRLVEEAMGKPVIRRAEGDDSPYSPDERDDTSEVRALIDGGETERVEFKSTARINLHTGNTDPKIEDSVGKTIAAFLNTQGGDLLIGVTDEGAIHGLALDYAACRGDRDGFQQWFQRYLDDRYDKLVTPFLRIRIVQLPEGEICWVRATVAPEPVFVEARKQNEEEKFYVRQQTATVALTAQKMLDYRKARWG